MTFISLLLPTVLEENYIFRVNSHAAALGVRGSLKNMQTRKGPMEEEEKKVAHLEAGHCNDAGVEFK